MNPRRSLALRFLELRLVPAPEVERSVVGELGGSGVEFFAFRVR